jgi:SAM-dependent methyltransferase
MNGVKQLDRADRNLLGNSRREIGHLVEQAEVYSSEANELFDAVAIEPGATAIDVGCGVMGVLQLLAERVGPAGRVVGLDREPRMIEIGRGLAQERGLTVEFVEADAAASGLPAGSFDLVHARTVLLNVDDPEAMVSEMLRLARWGGVIACRSRTPAPGRAIHPIPRGTSCAPKYLTPISARERTSTSGDESPRLLRDAGVEDVQVRATARITTTGDYYHTFLLTISTLLREVIVKGPGLASAELDRHTDALRRHLDAPTIDHLPAADLSDLGPDEVAKRAGVRDATGPALIAAMRPRTQMRLDGDEDLRPGELRASVKLATTVTLRSHSLPMCIPSRQFATVPQPLSRCAHRSSAQ